MEIKPILKFDTLYDNLCDTLRQKDLVVKFCEQITKFETDLARIDFLLDQADIQFLKEFSQNVRHSYECKSFEKAERLYNDAQNCSNELNSLRFLNKALCNLPYEFREIQFPKQTCEFLSWLEQRIDEETKFATSIQKYVLQSKILWSKIVLLEKLNQNNTAFHLLIHLIDLMSVGSIIPPKYEVILKLAITLRNMNSCSMLVTQILKMALKILKASQCSNELKCKFAVQISMALKASDSKNTKCTENNHLCEVPSCSNLVVEIPKLFGNRNEKLDSASDAIQLQISDTKGRLAVAQRDIPIGSVVIVEDPYVATLKPEFSHRFCTHCFTDTELKDFVYCSTCSDVIYCSVDCANKAAKYHQYECKIMNLITNSKTLGEMALLCYRTISGTELSALLKNYLSSDFAYSSANYESVHVQCTNAEKRKPGDLLKRAFAAIYLTMCLTFMGKFNDSNLSDFDEDQRQIAALLLRHLQSVSCNAYGINCNTSKISKPIALDEVGGGSYPIISITNHSCVPNVYRYYSGKTCFVRVIRKINPGDEILDSYGPLYYTMDTESRQKYLNNQYLFSCDCPSCKYEWDKKLNSTGDLIKCQKCGEVTNNRKCTKCGTDLKKIGKEVSFIMSKINEVKNLIVENSEVDNYSRMESEVTKLVQKLEVLVGHPNWNFVKASEVLKAIWHAQIG